MSDLLFAVIGFVAGAVGALIVHIDGLEEPWQADYRRSGLCPYVDKMDWNTPCGRPLPCPLHHPTPKET